MRLPKNSMFWLFLSLGVLTLAWATAENTASAQTEIQLTAAKAKALLRCPNDESKQFVDDCFELVQLGSLPEKVVLSAFQNAMDREKYQWYYFQVIVQTTTEKLKIDLDALRKDLHAKKNPPAKKK